jgi:hypothetical protein
VDNGKDIACEHHNRQQVSLEVKPKQSNNFSFQAFLHPYIFATS